MSLPIRRALSVLLWIAVIPLLAAATILPAGLLTITAGTAVTDWWNEAPADTLLPAVPQRSTIVDANGTFLAEVFLYDRIVVSEELISPLVAQAVVAVEDRRFYQHNGVDLEGIGRAMLANVKARGWAQGGSTITQQYVKNLIALQDLNGRADLAWQKASEKTLDRKFSEARLAMALERITSKADIITGYLNAASFGNQVFGIESASRFYFGTHAADLTLAQAALLAGMLQSPTAYDPLRHPDLAKKRRTLVLDRMVAAGYITQSEADTADRQPVPTEGTPAPGRCPQSYAPFYCHWVESQLLESPLLGATPEERRQRLTQGGLVIRTALDPNTQAAADNAIVKVPPSHRLAAAIAMVEPGTGQVKALATNRKWGTKGKGRTELLLPTREAFQTGSVFKAFTIAAALDSGIDPDTTLPAGPTYESKKFENPEKGYFSNYSTYPWKDLTLREALQWSVNTAFVQLQEKVGTLNVARTAHDLGLANLPLEGKAAIRETEGSLTLGARETSVLNVANGYASLAARGVACPPRAIIEITVRGGEKLTGHDAGCRQAVSPAAAAMTTDMLATVITDGTGENAKLTGRPAAGKTGTTNNSAAVWFAGFTPQLAAAVWIGDPRGPSFSVDGALGYDSMTGGTLPAEIWRTAMNDALAGKPRVNLPGPTGLSLLTGPKLKADQAAGTTIPAAD